MRKYLRYTLLLVSIGGGVVGCTRRASDTRSRSSNIALTSRDGEIVKEQDLRAKTTVNDGVENDELGSGDIPPNVSTLLATKPCPALHSIKKQSNPEDLNLIPGKRYVLRTTNRKQNPTYYQIELNTDTISGKEAVAIRFLRWVRLDCGTASWAKNSERQSAKVGAKEGSNKPAIVDETRPNSASPPGESRSAHFLLALSWQAAFCETHRRKPECGNQNADRYDSTHFSLHGLWPQPIENAYCGVNMITKSLDRKKKWAMLPRPKLSRSLRNRLREVMPGTASSLDRHEWIKHGTCYSDGPEEYYAESLQLLDQVNASSFRDFIAENIGKEIDVTALKTAFDSAFGLLASKKVGFRCDRGGRLTEIWINLHGLIESNTPVDTLLPKASAGRSNCRDPIMIDAAGF